MSTEMIEDLVIAKRMAEQQTQQMLSLIGAMAILNGTDNSKDVHELRISKATLNKLDGQQVLIRGLKSGSVVITVKKADNA